MVGRRVPARSVKIAFELDRLSDHAGATAVPLKYS